MNKNILFSCVMLLVCTLFVAVIPTEAEGAVYEDTVRLHILANSDSEEDQALKLNIRDAVLKEYADRLSYAGSADEAKSSLSEILPEIECFCENEVKRLGYDYDVSISLSEEWYDTREYESFTLPKGIYSSLRIFIGNGEGQNWWCVMYPPLCLDIATEKSKKDDAVGKYSSEEISLVSKKEYNVKFKLLELISDVFS